MYFASEAFKHAVVLWSAVFLVSAVALYFVIAKAKWNDMLKALVVLGLILSVCFSGNALITLLGGYFDYQSAEKANAEREEILKTNPLYDSEWEGDLGSLSISENDDFVVEYYETSDDGSSYVHVSGKSESTSYDKENGEVDRLKEVYKDILGPDSEELNCFCTYSVSVKSMDVNGESVDLKRNADASAQSYTIGFVMNEYGHITRIVVVAPDGLLGVPMERYYNSGETSVPDHEKPVIYLYPEAETKVSVQLSKPEDITCDYPEYNDGWNVIAKPNGDLYDVVSGKDLYCLYYECSADASRVEEDGFVVKSADTADFLDEKLKVLGLNDKERNEFIIYWLPKLEQNKYNYIRFLTETEIDKAEELNVNPKPDSVIRIMMSYKGLDRPINVREQKLKTAERAGFTVVEWGGTEIR